MDCAGSLLWPCLAAERVIARREFAYGLPVKVFAVIRIVLMDNSRRFEVAAREYAVVCLTVVHVLGFYFEAFDSPVMAAAHWVPRVERVAKHKLSRAFT
eukprot:3929744-Amphidinium_carterae.1